MPLKVIVCEPYFTGSHRAWAAGSSAKVAVGIGPGKKATFDFSLAGFSAAHDALKKKTGA